MWYFQNKKQMQETATPTMPSKMERIETVTDAPAVVPVMPDVNMVDESINEAIENAFKEVAQGG